MKLVITYQGELDTKLDEALQEKMSELGFDFGGSGYLLAEGKRDLEFSKSEDKSDE